MAEHVEADTDTPVEPGVVGRRFTAQQELLSMTVEERAALTGEWTPYRVLYLAQATQVHAVCRALNLLNVATGNE